MRRIRELGAGFTASVIVIGPPWLFVWWLRRTSWRRPGGDEVRRWVADPLTEQTVVAAIVALAALLWLLTAGIVGAAVVRRVRAAIRRVRQVRLPTSAQATATSMAGAAVFGVPAAAVTTTGPDTTPATGPPATGALRHPGAVTEDRHGAEVALVRGVDLPDGGWVPQPTADAVGSAAAVLWLRRRRYYRPDHVGAGTGDDGDLRPLPPSVAALQAAAGDAGHGAGSSATRVAGSDRLLPAGDLPAGGLALVGPGAYDAARGVLLTAVLTGTGDGPRAVITAADLRDLLGDAALGVPPVPGLRVVDSLDAAVDLLTDLPAAGHRAPQVGVSGWAPTLGAAGAARPVLVTRVPTDGDLAYRLTALLTPGSGCTGVLLGRWDRGVTRSVDTRGYVQDGHGDLPRGSRMCVLGARAAADLLTVTGYAYGTNPPAEPPVAASPSRWALSPGSVPAARPSDGTTTLVLRLQVLGRTGLTHHGEPVTVRRSAALQALILLAVYPRGATAPDLVEAIWPGLPPRTVIQRLYTTLGDLRKTLREHTGDTVLHRDGEHYHLDADRIDVDVWHLHTALHTAATTIAPGQRRTALTAVITGYTGHLAADLPWPWLDGPREALRRQVIDAYTDLADISDPREALRLVQDALTIDPFNEVLHQRAVAALTAAGEHTAANRLAETYQRRLTDAHLSPAVAYTPGDPLAGEHRGPASALNDHIHR